MSLIYSLYVINKSGGLIYSKVSESRAGVAAQHGAQPTRQQHSVCAASLNPPQHRGHRCCCCCCTNTTNTTTCCFWQEFEPSARLDLNDTLRLASIWCARCAFETLPR
jgi:hypothetical protein